MILAPDSESLREFNPCHDPGTGQFCSSPDVTFEHSLHDYHHGQHDGSVVARDGYGVRVGRMNFSLYNGVIKIGVIEVDEARRREGIAAQMLATLRAEYPAAGIDPGYRTPEGEKLWQAVKRTIVKPAKAPKPARGPRWAPARRGRFMLEANSCHTPAGSPQGGQFCSKGTQATGASPARQAAERIAQAAQRIGRRLGVKPGRVWVSHEARTFESGGLAFTESGSYDPKSGAITINARTGGDVDAVIAHEMTHHQFWTVKRLAGAGDARAQRFMAQAGLGMAADMRAVQAQLRKDDGVTPYSRAYWRSAKPGDFVAYQSAVDETLGELAALEHGQRDRIGTKTAHARWRALAKALRAAYPKES